MAGTLDANYGKGAGERGGVEREVIALQDVRDVQKAQNGRGLNADGSAYTLDTHAKAGRAMSSSRAETWVEAGVCNTLNTFDNGETRATVVAIEAAQPTYTMFTGDGEVADPITANEGKTYTHEGTTFRMHNCVGEHVGFYPTAGQDFPALNGCSPAVKVGSGGSAGNPPGIAMVFREAVSYTVSAKWAKGSGGYAGQNECDNRVLKTNLQDAHGPYVPSVAATLSSRDYKGPSCGRDGVTGNPVAPTNMAVRRLTPTECERLMGFPDGWTAIPWRKRPVSECPDGPRYKALGNSMAVNCMRFIGERIMLVDEVFSELEAAELEAASESGE